MPEQKFCQSCSMPLSNPSLHGTEKDGSPGADYCKFCYQHGEFTRPGITMQEMIASMKEKMAGRQLPAGIADEAIKRLPSLKRWANNTSSVTGTLQ